MGIDSILVLWYVCWRGERAHKPFAHSLRQQKCSPQIACVRIIGQLNIDLSQTNVYDRIAFWGRIMSKTAIEIIELLNEDWLTEDELRRILESAKTLAQNCEG